MNNFKFLNMELIYPEPILLIAIVLLMGIDLLSGVRKAKSNNESTTSRGLRKTFDKGSTYFGFFVAYLIMVNITKYADKNDEYTNILSYSVSGLLVFMCYIEFKSILENLIAISPETDLTNYLLKPLHNLILLKFNKKVENND